MEQVTVTNTSKPTFFEMLSKILSTAAKDIKQTVMETDKMKTIQRKYEEVFQSDHGIKNLAQKAWNKSLELLNTMWKKTKETAVYNSASKVFDLDYYKNLDRDQVWQRCRSVLASTTKSCYTMLKIIFLIPIIENEENELEDNQGESEEESGTESSADENELSHLDLLTDGHLTDYDSNEDPDYQYMSEEETKDSTDSDDVEVNEDEEEELMELKEELRKMKEVE